jgi:hypothetical protein
LNRAEDLRNVVCVNGIGRAGIESQVGSNAATMTLELDEPIMVIVAFKVRKGILGIRFKVHCFVSEVGFESSKTESVPKKIQLL